MSRELDVKVARALHESEPPMLGVLNYLWEEQVDGTWMGTHYWPEARAWEEIDWPPHYSDDIAEAWPLFERLGPAWQISQSDPGGWDEAYRWWCWLPTEYGGDGTQYMAPTPAEAICRAFLAAKEDEQ